MQKTIYLPALEPGIDGAIVQTWLVDVGDLVNESQPILEIEAQKAVSEVPSPWTGYIRKWLVDMNDTVAPGAALCIVTDTANEPFSTIAEIIARLEIAESSSHIGTGPSAATGIKALPVVRKLARELGVNLATVVATGSKGQITADDVKAVASRGATTASSSQHKDGWAELSANRIALNEQMQKSLAEIPQFHLVRQMDVTPLMSQAEGITFTHKLVQKIAQTLVEHPALRTSIQGTKIRVEPISVAVAIESKNGLTAPVVRKADELSLEQIATTLRDFRSRAESGTLQRDELIDGPFALSNLGMHGVDFFSAFVFHGQTAVLAVGRVTDTGPFTKSAWFNLAVDHRVVDGTEAARFLATLQSRLLS